VGVDKRSDAALVSASRLEPALIGVVYERHAAAVYRYLARRAPIAAAEDLLAEVFVAALTARKRVVLQASDSALPWLYGIAANVLRAHLRRAARKPPLHADHGMDWDAVDNRLDAQSQRCQLRHALANLSAIERDLLLLVGWEGLTPTQAADALGITPIAARSRLHRARTHAQEALAALEASAVPASIDSPRATAPSRTPNPEEQQ
jgi:RNA polymerase sigma factor (sigma-70 family)